MSKDNILDKEVLEVIRAQYDDIFSAERKVADFVLLHPQETLESNVAELAAHSGVSDATVVRMCRHIGYTGYYQFRLTLSRDLGRHQQSDENTLMETRDAVDLMFRRFAENMVSIGKQMDVDVMQHCVKLLRECGHAHLIAVGNTSPLAQYMGFRLGRLGIRCSYSPGPEYFMNHVNLAGPEDILVAISQSGTSKQVIQGMELGKEKGLKMIAITASPSSPVARLADHVLLSAGKDRSFRYTKSYAHLYMISVIDALLNFVTNEELIKATQADKPEQLLSEYKI